MNHRKTIRTALRSIGAPILFLLLSAIVPVVAQDYPIKPIRLISPFSAGGGG